MRLHFATLALPLIVSAARLSAADPWTIPPEGCHAATSAEDVEPQTLREGQMLHGTDRRRLRHLVPKAFLDAGDVFFHEEMRLEIGPCYRDYSAPAFFTDATRRFRNRAVLREDGGLEGHVAGLPFSPKDIHPEDSTAGLRWAWNAVRRYAAGGSFEEYRILQLSNGRRGVRHHRGRRFVVQLAHRADRIEGDPPPRADRFEWVAGGEHLHPSPSRGMRWLQFRRRGADPDEWDKYHQYEPELRRVTTGTFYLEIPSVHHIGVRPHGFRPGGYTWRVLGTPDVLAPINARGPLYPEAEDRVFGPWGLSLASDRWDVRRALVLEARPKPGRVLPSNASGTEVRIVRVLDLQTLRDLYYVSYDSDGAPVLLIQWIGRWSEDRRDYPGWPDDPTRPVRHIDHVGAMMWHRANDDGHRWETWNTVSVPPPDSEVLELLSVGRLSRGR